jgi:hypothetical protein
MDDELPDRRTFFSNDGWLLEDVTGGPVTYVLPYRSRTSDVGTVFVCQVYPYVQTPTRRSTNDFVARGWFPAPVAPVVFWTDDQNVAQSLMPLKRWEETPIWGAPSPPTEVVEPMSDDITSEFRCSTGTYVLWEGGDARVEWRSGCPDLVLANDLPYSFAEVRRVVSDLRQEKRGDAVELADLLAIALAQLDPEGREP